MQIFQDCTFYIVKFFSSCNQIKHEEEGKEIKREGEREREREGGGGREGERELAQIFISPYSVSIPFRPPAGGLEGALAVGPGWVPHRHLCLHPPPSETPLPAGSHSGWAR